VGDFNGDQDPDLAVANGFSGTVSVLLGGLEFFVDVHVGRAIGTSTVISASRHDHRQ